MLNEYHFSVFDYSLSLNSNIIILCKICVTYCFESFLVIVCHNRCYSRIIIQCGTNHDALSSFFDFCSIHRRRKRACVPLFSFKFLRKIFLQKFQIAISRSEIPSKKCEEYYKINKEQSVCTLYCKYEAYGFSNKNKDIKLKQVKPK